MVKRTELFTQISARRVCGPALRLLDAVMCLSVFVAVHANEHLFTNIQMHLSKKIRSSQAKNNLNSSDKQDHTFTGSERPMLKSSAHETVVHKKD